MNESDMSVPLNGELTPSAVAPTPVQDDEERWVNAIVAAQGDLKVVAEQINARLPQGARPVTQFTLMRAFLNRAATSTEVMQAIKALMMLNYLSIMGVAKDQLLAAIPDFSSAELIATFKLIAEGISNLQDKQTVAAAATNNTQMNFFSAETESARGKVTSMLQRYLPKEEDSDG